MLGSSKTGAVRALVAASSASSRDADLYRRYAAGLYRQALLTRGDPAPDEHVVCDVIVNERALARMPERGEDDARYRLGPRARAIRRPRVRVVGGLGYVRAADAVALYPRDLGTLWHAAMRRLASSSAVVAEADPLRSRRK